MNVLTDEDLAYRLPGNNVTLGELCLEMGEIERSYIEGFRTFEQDFDYRRADRSVAESIDKLKAWYAELDEDLRMALEELAEEDLNRPIDRGHNFTPTATMNFHIYREALLIFYAKADLYLKALEKQVDSKWRWWIGSRADWPTAG
jgi:hypothetical protein